jgi:hypothetical protein
MHVYRAPYVMSTTVPIQTNVPSHGNACGVLNNPAPLSDFIVRGGLGTGAFGVVYCAEERITSQTMALVTGNTTQLGGENLITLPRRRRQHGIAQAEGAKGAHQRV